MRHRIFAFSFISFLFVFMGCSPRLPPEASPAPSPDEERDSVGNQIPVLSETGPSVSDTDRSEPSIPIHKPKSKFTEPEQPDWRLRYQELYRMYTSTFSPPEPGSTVEVQLNSGRRMQGTLLELTEAEMKLNVPNGQITLAAETLSPASSQTFFVSFHAASKARQQAMNEYRRWQQQHTSVSSPPSANSSQESKPQPPVDGGDDSDTDAWFISPGSDDPMFPIPPRL